MLRLSRSTRPPSSHAERAGHDEPELRVLLISGSKQTRNALCHVLVDIEVTNIEFGDEALAALGDVDVVMINTDAPVLAGHDILAEFGQRSDLDELAVVIMATGVRPEDRHRAHQLGARAVIDKDDKFAHVVEVIDSVLAEIAHG